MSPLNTFGWGASPGLGVVGEKESNERHSFTAGLWIVTFDTFRYLERQFLDMWGAGRPPGGRD